MERRRLVWKVDVLFNQVGLWAGFKWESPSSRGLIVVFRRASPLLDPVGPRWRNAAPRRRRHFKSQSSLCLELKEASAQAGSGQRSHFLLFSALAHCPVSMRRSFSAEWKPPNPEMSDEFNASQSGQTLAIYGVSVSRHLQLYLCLTRPSIATIGPLCWIWRADVSSDPCQNKLPPSGWRVRSNPRDSRDATSSAVNFSKSSN